MEGWYIISHTPNPGFWGFKYDTLMWIRLPKQELAKLLTVPEKQTRLEKQIEKYTRTFRHIYMKKQIATTLQPIYIINKDHTSQNIY